LPKNNPPKRLRHTPRDKNPRTRAKNDFSQRRASYVMIKREENVLYLYDSMTFNLQNRSTK
jgi:hypothetical protein